MSYVGRLSEQGHLAHLETGRRPWRGRAGHLQPQPPGRGPPTLGRRALPAHRGEPAGSDPAAARVSSIGITARSGQTVLMKAAHQGKTDLVADLIRRAAPVDVANAHGHTALMLAGYAGQYEAVRPLLAGGADNTIQANSSLSAADMARERKHNEIVAVISAGGNQELER